MKDELTKKQKEMLHYTKDRSVSVNKLAEATNQSPSGVSYNVGELKKKGLVIRLPKGDGKKTRIRAVQGIKTNRVLYEILQEVIKRRHLSEQEIKDIINKEIKFGDEDWIEISLYLKRFLDYKINKEGKQFIKEYERNLGLKNKIKKLTKSAKIRKKH